MAITTLTPTANCRKQRWLHAVRVPIVCGAFSLCLAFAARPSQAQTPNIDHVKEVVDPYLKTYLEHDPADIEQPWVDREFNYSGTIQASAASVFNRMFCRTFKYTANTGRTTFIVNGQRCRDQRGDWVPTMVRDTDEIQRDMDEIRQVVDPTVKGLQTNLRSLAYYTGTEDGVVSMQLTRALFELQVDESVTADGVVSPAALQLSKEAVSRIARPGRCELFAKVPSGQTVACGVGR